MAPLPTLRGIGTLDNETVLVDLERLGSGGLGSGGLQGEPTVAGPTAVLTDRELTILRYLPPRLTNDEIARECPLSVKHGQGASEKHLRQAGHHLPRAEHQPSPAAGPAVDQKVRAPRSGADSGWYLLLPLVIAGAGLGLLVSQLNNYTLAPISEERVSEAAGVNSAAGSFGLSFGLAFAGAIMLAALSFAFTSMAASSTVLSASEQQQVATALEEDAEVMSNTALARAAGRSTPGNAGRDHQDQHRRPAAGPADRPVDPDPRRVDRAVQLVPDDAAAGPETVGLGRGDGPGLNPASAFRLADGVPQVLRTGVKGCISCPPRCTSPHDPSGPRSRLPVGRAGVRRR